MSRIVTIFGGQFGSEGKGEIASLFNRSYKLDYAIRIGGPNAGHTSYSDSGERVVVRSLPTPSALTGITAVIGPEACFIPHRLRQEVYEFTRRSPGVTLQVMIDQNSAIIGKNQQERERGLISKIGSTAEGVGAVTADKVMRTTVKVRGHGERSLMSFMQMLGAKFSVSDTSAIINGELKDKDGKSNMLLIEGTQGYGLSLHTGGYYPFCTSRECTPYALWSGTGINVSKANRSDVIMVVRTYPIRVGGNSGDLPGELTWEELYKRTNGYVTNPEMTTVTHRVRRIGEMDFGLLERAVSQCPVTSLAITFLDYVFPEVAGLSYEQIRSLEDKGVYSKMMTYLDNIGDRLCVPVVAISTGPGSSSFIPDAWCR